MGQRDPRAVIEDHLELRRRGALEDDLRRNYAPDVVLLTGTGPFRGHNGVRASAAELAHYLGPEPTFEITNLLVEGAHGFIEWTGRDGDRLVCDGADSFVVREGRIVAQTIHYTVHGDDEGSGDH